MEMKDDNEHIKRRVAKRLYRFRKNHVKLLEPVGNRLRSLFSCYIYGVCLSYYCYYSFAPVIC